MAAHGSNVERPFDDAVQQVSVDEREPMMAQGQEPGVSLAEELARCEQALAASEAAREKLEQRVRELEYKQVIVRGELRRAEGQVDLIRDLLLRDHSL